ncbi:hypothetical protein [Haladaptatus sp. NG-WS-4]
MVVRGGENGEINRFVLSFGVGQDGELHVLTSQTGSVRGSGSVFELVPPDDGERLSAPDGETTTTAVGTTTS